MKLAPQKLEGWGYRMVKISYPNINRFSMTDGQTDRQTEGQTDGQ